MDKLKETLKQLAISGLPQSEYYVIDLDNSVLTAIKERFGEEIVATAELKNDPAKHRLFNLTVQSMRLYGNTLHFLSYEKEKATYKRGRGFAKSNNE